MIRQSGVVIGLALLALGIGFASSIWQEVNIYKMTIRPGDIIRIRFIDKTLMKYKIESRSGANEDTKGKQISGDKMDFYPSLKVTDTSDSKSQNSMTMNNEARLIIPALVSRVSNQTIYLQARTESLINDEVFSIDLYGICNARFVKPDYTVSANNIYQLTLSIRNRPQDEKQAIAESDLLFTTNITKLMTNRIVGTNGVTNLTIVTNESSIKIEFAGITGTKKRELLLEYLNTLVYKLLQ